MGYFSSIDNKGEYEKINLYQKIVNANDCVGGAATIIVWAAPSCTAKYIELTLDKTELSWNDSDNGHWTVNITGGLENDWFYLMLFTNPYGNKTAKDMLLANAFSSIIAKTDSITFSNNVLEVWSTLYDGNAGTNIKPENGAYTLKGQVLTQKQYEDFNSASNNSNPKYKLGGSKIEIKIKIVN